ncbi:MAG: nucleotidyltransferase domain-containing protein [Candidatus Nomurabacteria bacterium]|jgi:type I restriction enzyme S subunit|nr:nucleotidyltransferase domain-containing protein [Candidatus Nomurabacteria bacterium]
MISLLQEYQDFIKTTITTALPTATIFIFGSRSTGQPKDFSDIDIAISDNTPIDPDTLRRLSDAFEFSRLPYKVDLIDLNNISDDFRNIITKDLQKL